jgi:sorting nexin-1/2
MVESNQDAGDDGVITDPTVYEKNSEVAMNDYEFEFSVGKPVDNGGRITYEVRGKDRHGVWEIKRRYNDFFLLRELLTRRFPGVPVPQVPPKKAIGNKDVTFIQDRTFYLQRFLRKLARFQFIIESPEMQAFCRPQGGDVEKALGRMLPMSTIQLYDRIKALTDVDTDVENYLKETSAAKINTFNIFIRQIEPVLNNIKNDLSRYLMSKQRSIQAYGEMAKFTQRYEELNVTHYMDMNPDKLIFTNPNDSTLRDGIIICAQSLRNPYIDLYHWVKGELYDLEAMKTSIASRQQVVENRNKLEGKKLST